MVYYSSILCSPWGVSAELASARPGLLALPGTARRPQCSTGRDPNPSSSGPEPSLSVGSFSPGRAVLKACSGLCLGQALGRESLAAPGQGLAGLSLTWPRLPGPGGLGSAELQRGALGTSPAILLLVLLFLKRRNGEAGAALPGMQGWEQGVQWGSGIPAGGGSSLLTSTRPGSGRA